MNLTADALWHKISAAFFQRIGEERYNFWTSRISPLKLSEDECVFAFEDSYFRSKFDQAYKKALKESVRNITNRKTHVVLVIDEVAFPINGVNKAAEVIPLSSRGKKHSMTLDDFIVDDNNRLALKAVQYFIEQPRGKGSPLFISGETGLGKTHLLQSIYYDLVRKLPAGTLALVSNGQVRQQYLSALYQNRLNIFRRTYSSAKVFLVDNLHVLAQKKERQEELAYLLEALDTQEAKIAVTSLIPQRNLCVFSSALQAKLRSGIFVELGEPTYTTRVRFLQHQSPPNISQEILHYIARHITSNMKDLLWCVEKLKLARNFSLNSAQRVVRMFQKTMENRLTSEDIARSITSYFQLEMSSLYEPKRNRKTILARHLCYYFSRELLHQSFEDIAGEFHQKSHSTVLWAYQNIKKHPPSYLPRLARLFK